MSTTPTGFPRFLDLPAELRIKIFFHAIADVRPFRVWVINSPKPTSPYYRSSARGAILITQVTTFMIMASHLQTLSLLQACSLSRQLFLGLCIKRGVYSLCNNPWLHMYRPTRYGCDGETVKDLLEVVTYGPMVESAHENGSDV